MATATKDAPKAPEAPANPLLGLFDTLLAKVKELGATTTEKAAYHRVNLGKVTVVYANKPTSKNIRLEIPKVKGGGYDVVKVTTEKQLDKALADAFARAAKKQEADAAAAASTPPAEAPPAEEVTAK